MKRFLSLLAPVLCLLLTGAATPAPTVPVELAPGLRYLRVDSLVQSTHALSDALLRPEPLVLDLRYVLDEANSRDALLVLNSQPAKPRLYVLVSSETPKGVANVLATSTTRLITLGITGSQPKPEVVVDQTATDDRRAYAALDQGTSLAALVSGKVDKEHFDEAELVKEFKSGNHDAHPPEGNPDATKPAGQVTDRVLQRAVHLHKALEALKR